LKQYVYRLDDDLVTQPTVSINGNNVRQICWTKSNYNAVINYSLLTVLYIRHVHRNSSKGK